MRFVDPFIKIHFKHTRTQELIDFKAFLEDVQHNITYEDKPLPYATGYGTNIAVLARAFQNIKINLNVYAEDREECYYNFQKLKWLIKAVQPRKSTVGLTYQVDPTNTTGLIEIKFAGLQPLKEYQKVHIISFGYEINKDLGYILMDENADNVVKYKKADIQMYPIGFKISMEARIINPPEIKVDTKIENINRGTVVTRAEATVLAEVTVGASQTPAASQSGGTGSSGRGADSEAGRTVTAAASRQRGGVGRGVNRRSASTASIEAGEVSIDTGPATYSPGDIDVSLFSSLGDLSATTKPYTGQASVSDKLLPALTPDDDDPVTQADVEDPGGGFPSLVLPGYNPIIPDEPINEVAGTDVFEAVDSLSLTADEKVQLKFFLYDGISRVLYSDGNSTIATNLAVDITDTSRGAVQAWVNAVVEGIRSKKIAFLSADLGLQDPSNSQSYFTQNSFGRIVFFNEQRFTEFYGDRTEENLEELRQKFNTDSNFALIPIQEEEFLSLQQLGARAAALYRKEANRYPKPDDTRSVVR